MLVVAGPPFVVGVDIMIRARDCCLLVEYLCLLGEKEKKIFIPNSQGNSRTKYAVSCLAVYNYTGMI